MDEFMRDFIKKGLLGLVGKRSDGWIRDKAADWWKSGELDKNDCVEIDAKIEAQYVTEEIPEEITEEV